MSYLNYYKLRQYSMVCISAVVLSLPSQVRSVEFHKVRSCNTFMLYHPSFCALSIK